MINLTIHKKLQSATGEMNLKVKLDIESGAFLTFYGKSGVGKTSLLRILAGLLPPDQGKIVVDGVTWFDDEKGINVTPQKRNVGMVFQDYALFPNMSVKENLLFGLGKGQDKNIVDQLIEITELGELQHRNPATLSGGQKQRTALARALVQKPKILLLDEPLSALDVGMRSQLQQYILQLHQEFNLTTILVSHDVSEILKTSDKMVVLEEGEIVKQGTPSEVFSHNEISGKFQFTGELIAIEKQDFMFILTIIIGKELVKVVADENEAKTLRVGDKLLVASKAFNPIIKKIG